MVIWICAKHVCKTFHIAGIFILKPKLSRILYEKQKSFIFLKVMFWKQKKSMGKNHMKNFFTFSEMQYYYTMFMVFNKFKISL